MKIKKIKLAGKKNYINEDLTYCNLRHLQQAREEHKDCPVWTIDGKVFFRTEAGRSEHVPNDTDDFKHSLYAYVLSVIIDLKAPSFTPQHTT